MSLARKVLFPIRHADLWHAYKTAFDCLWKVEEVDLSDDYKDWTEKLNDDERYFLKHVLAFFAAADSIVNINLIEYMQQAVPELEAQYFINLQIAMECVHTEQYNLLILALVPDEREQHKLLNAFEDMECVRKKAQWALKWTKESSWLTKCVARPLTWARNWLIGALDEAGSELARRVVAFAFVEGVFFSGSFAAIFFIKTKNIMPGLTFSNQLISRDEGLHTSFACTYYNKYVPEKDKPSSRVILQMAREAVAIEKEFFTEALKCDLIGMNTKLMCQYIEFVADQLLVMLNQKKYFHATNPFDFMNNIVLEGKTNFFEKRVGEYKRYGAGDETYELLDNF